MKTPLYKNQKSLFEILEFAEDALLSGFEVIKFEKTKRWREDNLANVPGVYALYENKKILRYIGETANLKKRMNDLCRSGGHAFRRQLGRKKFEAVTIKGKRFFTPKTEAKIDSFLTNNLYVAFIKVNFGRLEIESYLIKKHQEKLWNSEKKGS